MIDEQQFAQQIFELRNFMKPPQKEAYLQVIAEDHTFGYFTEEEMLLKTYQATVEANDNVRFHGDAEYWPLSLEKTGEDDDYIYYEMKVQKKDSD